MLRKNVFPICGLANSSIGTVYEFLYSEDQTPGKDIPTAVLVDFPGYFGPQWSKNAPPTVVPVGIATSYLDKKGWQRKTIPLDVSYGLTMHKSQGLTLDGYNIWLDKPEGNHIGRTYVAMTRARDPNDICIRRPPDGVKWKYFRDIRLGANGKLNLGDCV